MQKHFSYVMYYKKSVSLGFDGSPESFERLDFKLLRTSFGGIMNNKRPLLRLRREGFMVSSTEEMSTDRLSQFCDWFGEVEQNAIQFAEKTSREILAQGTAAAAQRRIAAGSQELDEFVVEPENDARADAAGTVFFAYANALWRRTEAQSDDSVQEFLAKVDQLVEPLLERYGMAARGQLAQMQNDLRRNIQLYRIILKASADELEQGGKDDQKRKTVSVVRAPDILQFFTPWRERKRREAKLNAACARHLGRNAAEVERQEKLLDDARAWTKADLRDTVSGVRDLPELKERTFKRLWDDFLPTHPHRGDLHLGFRAFGTAIWEEGWPSIQDCAMEALLDRATSADKVQPSDKRIIPAEGGDKNESCQEAPPRRRGRRPNASRRRSIQSAIDKYGDDWRDHLPDIYSALEANDVFLGDFQGFEIDLDDGQHVTVSKWSDLDLAEGTQRKGIVDVLRKYRD